MIDHLIISVLAYQEICGSSVQYFWIHRNAFPDIQCNYWKTSHKQPKKKRKLISITMHNVGLNTSVQTWSKPFVWTFTSVFFFAHTFCFFVGILVAPQLFSSSSIVGKVCHPQNLTLQNEQGQSDIELKECIPLGKVSIPPVPLEDTVISFRFPEPSNEVSWKISWMESNVFLW